MICEPSPSRFQYMKFGGDIATFKLLEHFFLQNVLGWPILHLYSLSYTGCHFGSRSSSRCSLSHGSRQSEEVTHPMGSVHPIPTGWRAILWTPPAKEFQLVGSRRSLSCHDFQFLEYLAPQGHIFSLSFGLLKALKHGHENQTGALMRVWHVGCSLGPNRGMLHWRWLMGLKHPTPPNAHVAPLLSILLHFILI